MSSRMLEEARQAPEAVAGQLAHDEPLYREIAEAVRGASPAGVVTLGRGSSGHAASYLGYLTALLGGRLATSLPMSLLTLYGAELDAAARLLAVAISQSGQSPDLVEPMSALSRRGAITVALVNEEGSPLARAVRFALPLRAGEERSVAATKSFVCSLSAGARLAVHLAGRDDLLAALGGLPGCLARASAEDWSPAVASLASAERAMVLARGPGLAVAREAALKLMEVCGIQAEAFSGAEVRHGPQALVGPGYPVLVLALRGPAQPELLAFAEEARGRGARVLLAAPESVAGRDLTLATAPHELLDPITALQPLYPLVEALALARGRDPDRPPFLGKVTITR